MGYWLSIGTSQSTDAANNTSTVYVDLYLNSNNGSSWWGTTIGGSINIGGNVVGFSRSSGGSSSGSWSALVAQHAVTFIHDTNGYRGAVGTAGYFGPGSNVPSLSVGGTTYGAIDYDRKPGAPASATATLNSDKSITVVAGGASSPAGTATYYVQYASSTDGGLTWTAFGSQQTMSGQSYTWTTLAPGMYYKFRVWATNSDGTGPSAESNSLLLPSGFKVKTEGGLVHARTVKIKDTDGVWKDVRTFKIMTASGWQNAV